MVLNVVMLVLFYVILVVPILWSLSPAKAISPY